MKKLSTYLGSLRRMGRAENGNVAMLFGLSVIPVVVAMGVAVDYTRMRDVQNRLQLAVDGMALSATRIRNKSAEEIKVIIEQALKEQIAVNGAGEVIDVIVEPSEKKVKIDALAEIPASMTSVLGYSTLQVSAATTVAVGSGTSEVVLVLDNTGSMVDDMPTLKAASKGIVASLFGDGMSSTNVKIAVVPYTGAVNIGNKPAHVAWMDTNGDNSRHGRNFENWGMSESTCPPPPDDGTSGGGGSTNSGGSAPPPPPGPDLPGSGGDLTDAAPAIGEHILVQAYALGADVAKELVGAGQAQAQTAGTVPDNLKYVMSADGCTYRTPPKINHFDLFDAISNAEWNGCVEARGHPFDVNDTEPDWGNPNTLWVPYFWPDEPDGDDNYRNDYMDDALRTDPIFWDAPWQRVANTEKFMNLTATIDETSRLGSGPNLGCPTPILPLTNDRNSIERAIDDMQSWSGGGTNTAQGIAWGMRVLTSRKPFNQGQPPGVDENKKFMLVMSDGVNAVVSQGSGSRHKTDYTAYDYGHWNTLGQEASWTPEQQFHAGVNERMALACENAKAEGIEIFTVLFRTTHAPTVALMEACASDPDKAFTPDNQADLIANFEAAATEMLGMARVTE